MVLNFCWLPIDLSTHRRAAYCRLEEQIMGRKLLAGILGGIAFFAWSSLAHIVLPLGQTGTQPIPNEQAVIDSLKANIPADGFYFFPTNGMPQNATQSQRMAAMQELASKNYAGPGGILIYHPVQSLALQPRQLLTEAGTNVLQVLLAVLLLGQTTLASFIARWRFITIAGVLAAISTNISYWTFYGFPGNYTLAYILTVAMGFVCAGVVAAAIVKPGAGMPLAKGATA
jgi:hypothetical protein